MVEGKPTHAEGLVPGTRISSVARPRDPSRQFSVATTEYVYICPCGHRTTSYHAAPLKSARNHVRGKRDRCPLADQVQTPAEARHTANRAALLATLTDAELAELARRYGLA